MKNILVVGFGAMGCRHVQSLMAFPDKYRIHVLEPVTQNIETNTEKIGADSGDISWYSDLAQVDPNIDLAIIATSSGPRFEIVKSLLQKGIRLFLLEKIVFQSASQFQEVIELIDKHSAKAYCNFVNRYFNSYNEIKQKLTNRKSPFQMLVYGGEFGLGCNAIHYIDIFQYISGETYGILMEESNLQISNTGNRRGQQYKEFTGVMRMRNNRTDTLSIVSDIGFQGGVIISIIFGEKKYLLSEGTGKMVSIEDNINITEFNIIPTSRLTSTIVQDMLSGNCRLTQLNETAEVHKSLFNEFNPLVYGKSSPELLCPIT